MNWITCKIVATGIQGIANDFAMCNEHINCPELRLMQETLLLLKPALDYIDGGVGKSHFWSMFELQLGMGRSVTGKLKYLLLRRSFFLGNYNSK